MLVPRFFVLPALLLAGTAGYIALGASGGSVAEPQALPTPTAEHARLAAPTATPLPADTLPDGVAGTLTYRTGHDEVTVRLPGAAELRRGPSTASAYAMTSADGLWTADSACKTTPGGLRSCVFTLKSSDGRARTMTMDIDLQYSRSVQWSPSGHRLAILKQGDASSGVAILNDPDPASGEPTDVGTPGISAFTWASDRTAVIAAHGSDFGPALFRVDANSGTEEMLAKLQELPNFLYPSPNHSMVAFTGNSNDGWHLYLFDTRQTGVLRDLGAMGSDGPDGQPVPQGAPDVKTPMYIAWSPDGSQLAFGGGMDPPYVMHIIDIASGAVRVTEFTDGYPGEIKWSPDGALLAVSTYNIPRTHHESYVVDPATGLARDVLSGCVIVWSPDSRFLAIHGEVVPGVAIADVHTLAHAQLTHTIGDTPLRWDP